VVSEAASTASLEQATSCMYSLAREHMDSKTALVKAGALRALSQLLSHESKQCQLNSCATLYAISCAGRDTCKSLSTHRPLDRLTILVNPGPGRTPQDDQLQLFAALLIVNLLHVKGITTKEERALLTTSLQRAYDDATEQQVRDTIAIGLKRLSAMGSRKGQIKQRLSVLMRSKSSRASSSSASHFDGSSRPMPPAGTGAHQSGGGSSSGMQGFGSPGSVPARRDIGVTSSGSSGAPGTGRSRAVSSALKGGLSSLKKGAVAGAAAINGKTKAGGYHGSDSAHWED